MSRKTEIQVGLTVLAALAILLWGVTWLKDLQLRSSVNVWTVTFPEIGGLAASDEVQVNGIKKGAVRSIALVGDGVLVELAIASEVILTRDSRVTVRNVGLMGEKVIAVDLRGSGEPYTARDTIPGQYEKGIPEVMGDVATTISAVTVLTERLAELATAADRQGDLSGTMRNVRVTSDELRQLVGETRGNLRDAMANLAATAATTRELTTDREAQLKKTLDDFASAAARLDRLAGGLDSLRTSLHSVTNKLDRGDGTLGKLLNDRRLYNEFSATVDSLRVLIADIKKNPKRYLKLEIF